MCKAVAKIDFIASEFGASVVEGLLREPHSEQHFSNIEAAETLIVQARNDAPFMRRLERRQQTETDQKNLIAPIFKAFIHLTDPSPNAKYAEWIALAYLARMQKRDPLKAGELYKIHDDLQDFEDFKDQMKALGHSTNIHTYRGYKPLMDVMMQIRDAATPEGMAALSKDGPA